MATPAGTAEAVDDEAYRRFAAGVMALLGLDLLQYKRQQVWRRANAFGRQKGFVSCDALVAACRTDPALRLALRDMLTINVSEFFRDPAAWEGLRTVVLPALLRQGRPIRFWSAGCSLGYEPYTFGMVAREAGALAPSILATDLDETALERARTGVFTERQMAGVSPSRRGRFFEPSGDRWLVRPMLRDPIEWRRHDLLRDPFPADLDLVACRNVVIYFTEDAKLRLYRRFAAALRVGGTLFIGATEAIVNPRAHGLETVAPGLYRRAA